MEDVALKKLLQDQAYVTSIQETPDDPEGESGEDVIYHLAEMSERRRRGPHEFRKQTTTRP